MSPSPDEHCVRVLAALRQTTDPHPGLYVIGKDARLRTLAVIRALNELTARGLVYDAWQTKTEAAGKPARRYYGLTERGRALHEDA